MLNEINKAIYTKLSGTSAVTTLLSSATAIYFEVAPPGAVLPYIIFNHAAGGDDNETQLDSGDVMYYIKGVMGTSDSVSASSAASTAAAIAGAVRNALHKATLTIDSPWVCYSCQHVNLISYIETSGSKIFRHMGGSYRIRVSQ